MHDYSVNAAERKAIPFYIAALSMIIVFLLKTFLTIPEWLPVPSAFVLYGILYSLFDKFVWQWNWLHKIGLIKTPDLNGDWLMDTTSTVTNYNTVYTGRLKIEQSWTGISLFFEGSMATSMSVMASLYLENNTIYTLRWEYLSKRKPEFSDEEYMHYGITKVQWTGFLKDQQLEGDYYTDRSRHQYGQVTIKKA